MAFNTSRVVAVVLALVTTFAAHAQGKNDDFASKCPGMAAWQAAHRHAIPDVTEHKPDAGASDPKLQRQLLHMYAEDQQASAAALDSNVDGKPDQKLMDRWHAVSADNLVTFKGIVQAHGFPTVAAVGKDGVFAAFILAQHADKDPAFQASVLPMLQSSDSRDAVPAEMLAYLTDRILVAQQKKQRFGTQLYPRDGKMFFRPIESLNGLDALRTANGLPMIADYSCLMSARTGMETVRPST